MSDDVRRLSDELARDPGSLVFIPLGDALRRQGQLDLALKVAVRGLERHPHNADAHDLLARICVDRGELDRAFDEWDMVVRLAPAHAGAKKGMGFICYRQGRFGEAERYLAAALAATPADPAIASALAHVRGEAGAPGAEERPSGRGAASGPPQDTRRGARAGGDAAPPPSVPSGGPRMLFADVIGDSEQTALLLDGDGYVLAGAYLAPDGRDVAQEVGAELSGVSDEAERAMRHLDLGGWSTIVVETDVAVVSIAPSLGHGLVLLASARSMPLGLVRRYLDRAAEVARVFVEKIA
ncbi:MAG TPA: tetratricopeptide repeat protein [Gemmatimonadaceae bacterium]|nr:tetratricopeptide repeat protein [Gemmatimonadaceae bacterium]